MIAKAVKGRGFRGTLAYDLNPEKGRVIDTNMSGTTERELAKEFGEVRNLRPKLGKAVLHVSLSAAPGEHLSDEQWREVSMRYLHGMGLENNQYMVTRHLDTEHEHVHLLVNRIRFDGGVTSDSHDYRRQEMLMRAIEREYDLQRVQPSIDVQRHAPTKGEIEEGLRTGQPSTRQRLQQLCDAAAKDCDSFSDYAARLEAVDVQLVPVVQLEGRKMSGLSYVLDGVMMKGSDLGRGYSPMGLAKRGVSYDKERDGEAVSRCIERSQAGVLEPADRALARSEARERGRTSDLAGTFGASDGRPDGRNAGESGANRAARQGAEQAVPHAARDRDQDLAQRDEGGAAGGRAAGGSRAANGDQPLSAGRDDRNGNGAARERILALAGTSADHAKRIGRERSGGVTQARDRNAEAAQRQMTAMGVSRFVVTLKHAAEGNQEEHHWDKEEVMHGIAWLKRMNARGYDVLIRPDGEHGLVLLDGLTKVQLDTLRQRGFSPAVVVDTDREHCQAWVKLSNASIAEHTQEMATRGLRAGLGLPTGKGNSPKDGRLAGLTNWAVKSKHDIQPYALVIEAAGKVAPAAPAYLERIRQELGKHIAQLAKQRDASRGRSR
ncbi:relaxase/mobilization nuclease domain-containing protein [Duganella sp. FT135W]|uniref:Relaxase/mobilization nuclease domain-containing protein n=2 Tax=Duganella flavida TaxID=2692175 RepID=A0A6L8K6V7_9BURK|nr:relaxase/mobilization nuclease domain-containing protein [Duganella flavida]